MMSAWLQTLLLWGSPSMYGEVLAIIANWTRLLLLHSCCCLQWVIDSWIPASITKNKARIVSCIISVMIRHLESIYFFFFTLETFLHVTWGTYCINAGNYMCWHWLCSVRKIHILIFDQQLLKAMAAERHLSERDSFFIYGSKENCPNGVVCDDYWR